jgi:hypothetical protein
MHTEKKKLCGMSAVFPVFLTGKQKHFGRAVALLVRVSVSGTQKECGRAVSLLYLYQNRREIVLESCLQTCMTCTIAEYTVNNS